MFTARYELGQKWNTDRPEMVTECERELQWANYECLCLKLPQMLCRKCKNSIKVCRLPF